MRGSLANTAIDRAGAGSIPAHAGEPLCTSDNAIVFKIKAEEYVADVYSNDGDDPGEGPSAEGGIPGGGSVPLPG